MSCEVEQIGDCGDTATLGRALFIADKEDTNWLAQCSVSLSPCGNLLAVGYKNRLCLLSSQWISATDSNTYLISWSGTLSSDISVVLVLPICPSQQSSQNGPDWFCVIVGFKSGNVAFYTDTGHLLLCEKLDEKPVMKLTCHTGTYGTLPDDIHILYPTCQCIISGPNLFQTLRNAKSQLAKVQAGIQDDYSVDSRSINIRKWSFADQEVIHDASVVGLELKNSYDHLLAASTYGGYETWYRSVPPVNSLILGTGVKPYIGFHYALEGGTTPPLQDVARAVANKIKSALPGWLGGGNSESTTTNTEPLIRAESLSLRNGLADAQRQGAKVTVSPDRRLAAFTDNLGRVAVLDIKKGHLIRMFKGCRDAECAFVQIFNVDKKVPHMDVVKDIKRAIFLIIYNAKKGLIDIRLMQRGNRVAVFTATKNGKLIYNTCGLVGAEKNYTHKKLNLPEFQCVLIDPDGKLKKINIPFFYALEGEHSERAKDLHILRDLRDYIKKTQEIDASDEEIIKKAAEIKTLDIKRHCLEMLIKKYEIPIQIIMSCLSIFWDSVEELDLQDENTQVQEMKCYFANLALVTLFFRNINNENTDDMQDLCVKIRGDNTCEEPNKRHDITPEDVKDFNLLEDDGCILERLLLLVQESNYKEQPHSKVTFACNRDGSYKEFLSCFILDEISKYISLKNDISVEKLKSLAADTFESIIKIKHKTAISDFVRASNIDPRDVVKLIIIHLMDMPLEKITIDMIENIIEILFFVCCVDEEAKNISYNEVSPWWQKIRDLLVDMSCPLRSLVVAMACKAVGAIFESKYNEKDEDAWESVTTENAKWGILIGKLEDISILSVILMFKDEFKGMEMPKIQFNDIKINLKFIYTRGKGSVTELIAKWLCSMGVPSEAIVANELLEMQASKHFDSPDNADEDDSTDYVLLENYRYLVDDNPKIFKWISLLRRQFPLSTTADYLVANMCWEYAIAWQKNLQNTDELQAVVSCLSNISRLHLRLGLYSIIWSTYIKHTFEAVCRLVNKVGRLPKDPLCIQDVGFNNANMTIFLQIVTDFLSDFMKCSSMSIKEDKTEVKYEKIWEESMPSLVEVAQDGQAVKCDILSLNYQVACTIYYMCYFNVKCSKPLDALYDVDYQYILEALAGNVDHREISLKASEKIRNPRMKFITKLIRAAIETITQIDSEMSLKKYNNEECNIWMKKILILAELWNVEVDFVKRQQIVAVYHLGYDTLTETELSYVKVPELVLPPLLAISIQRLKRSLEQSSNQPEWIVSVSPNLYKRLQNTVLDTSIPAHPSLATTKSVLQKVLSQVQKKSSDPALNLQNIKIAELIIENCEVLETRKL